MAEKKSYTIYLPSYTCGRDAYKQIPFVTRFFGKTAVVIGGKTAISKSREKLLIAVSGSGVKITDFIWYGGNSTYENTDALTANASVESADMIFAVGGGRACDCVKCVADKLDKPVFTFPTVGSNCAPVTAISVMYNADGTFKDYYYPELPAHCFIDSEIIADSPERLLWAGIGDALSKECEAVFASDNKQLSHTPLMGRQLSRVCTNPLVEYGAAALESVKNHKVSFELEQVVLDIIVSTGIVSNMMTTKDDYYYNSSIAHCIYYAATVTEKGRNHLHGEVVALGVLCLLLYDGQMERFNRIMKFNSLIGLPVCFDDVEIKEDEFGKMADVIEGTTEWAHKPSGVTIERLLEVMKEVNRIGRELKSRG